MATSPNFSWPEPDNTDLVKNGALAIRTAVDAIDSSMADLKGGSTNQVLAKNSNTDMDFKWVADASGIPATILDAKGDLIAATAADTASRLAVGTDGQVLTADSTAATGIKWATASGGSSFPAFSAYKSTTDQTGITSGTWAKVTFNSEDFDTNNNFASNAFTPTVAGYYQLNAAVYADCSAAADSQIALYKNGTRYRRFSIRQIPATNASIVNGSILVYANGSTDYFEVYYRPDGGTSTVYAGIEITYFQGIGIRA